MIKKFPLSNFKLWLFISVLFTFSNAFSNNWYVNDNSTANDTIAKLCLSASLPKLTFFTTITLTTSKIAVKPLNQWHLF
jgi:hypothetical protein